MLHFVLQLTVFTFVWSASAAGINCQNSSQKQSSNFLSQTFSFDEADAFSEDEKTTYTHKLFVRLTGQPAFDKDPTFLRARSLVSKGEFLKATQLVVRDPNFLQNRVLNFAAPFTNIDESPRVPLDDLQALIVGVTRDELDARLILTGNLSYRGYSSLGLPKVSPKNNAHYKAFEDGFYSFDTDLQRVNDQWDGLEVGTGALTTRSWAAAHYDAGTNRRAVKYAFQAFLCSPIEQWKTRGAPDAFVRRDVDRAPGGVPSTFQNHCRGCHGMMDAMGGAFAKMDFVEDQFIHIKDGIADKMNQNASIYPLGYVTTDDSWHNLLDYNQSIDFGWRSEKSGTGIQAFAEMLSQSFAFSQCMVKKTFIEVCGQRALNKAKDMVDPLATDFENNNYNLKYLFANIASKNACIQHGKESKL